ncbi:DUF383-domain-containing protein [Microthyrium microscopicum]|uniref:Protein HGH1 homolog n=1 Tax=Microthyrium microscopicum TaxID=703497 RepID=A0A6A6UPQ7_9PEZI|nr:DUF383-domain-containing protein [Microthyrium microscopicum]
MPTELEELVEFLHHGNTTIRQLAAENLVGYSHAQPSIFKADNLTPIKDLKLLIRDHPPIAKNALTILINLSSDPLILTTLATDETFLHDLLTRVTDATIPTALELTQLIANLSKHKDFQKVLTTNLPARPSLKTTSTLAIDHLLTVFLLGEGSRYNANCDYAYLAYAFADLAHHPAARTYLTTPRADDHNLMPLSKILVFTDHADDIRRRGVANTIKNVCFQVSAHPSLLAPVDQGGANLLPFILLPLMGAEEYADDEMEAMLDECQLLPPDKEREKDADILVTHLDTLLLLTTTRKGREEMRRVQVYPIVRECHMAVDDEGVRDACDRLVQVLARDEQEGEEKGELESGFVDVEEEDEDMQIQDVI